MKKLFFAAIIGLALAACGGSNQTEANRDSDENTESNEPTITNDEASTDTTNTMRSDTTTTTP